MKKVFTIILILSSLRIVAQQSGAADIPKEPPPKTGLSYDVFSKYIQSNLTSGKDGGFDFKTTILGLKKVFSKTNFNNSDYYNSPSGWFTRNMELNFGVHKPKNGDDYNLLNGGFKFALINHRELSSYNAAPEDSYLKDLVTSTQNEAISLYHDELKNRDSINLKNIETLQKQLISGKDNIGKEFTDSIIRLKTDSLKLLRSDSIEIKRLKKELSDSTGPDADGNVKSPLKQVLAIMDTIIFRKSGTVFTSAKAVVDSIHKNYDAKQKKIAQKGLLTFAGSSGYDWTNKQAGSSFVQLEYLKGLGNYEKPWQIDIKTLVKWDKDTLASKSNLNRHLWTSSLSCNKVFATTKDNNPLIEIESAFQYDYIPDNVQLYKNEKNSTVSAIATLRIHLSKELTVPLSVKYDINNPNLLGIFRLQWNLETK